MATLGPPPPIGFNWVALARWMTVAYGALAFVSLLAIGFVAQYLVVPVQDPATGRIVNETVNLRPILLTAAIVVAVLLALFTWLIGYAIARVIVLVLTVLGPLAARSRMSGEPATAVVGSLVPVLFDAAFGFVLLMSFVAPQRSGS
jgi:hypothetical protein